MIARRELGPRVICLGERRENPSQLQGRRGWGVPKAIFRGGGPQSDSQGGRIILGVITRARSVESAQFPGYRGRVGGRTVILKVQGGIAGGLRLPGASC